MPAAGEVARRYLALVTGEAALRAALLDLGLEDLIALPEALEAVEVREAVRGPVQWTAVAEALRSLVTGEQVRVYRGDWDDQDPAALSNEEALAVLGDERWYSWRNGTGEYCQQRLWFVNVDNLRDA